MTKFAKGAGALTATALALIMVSVQTDTVQARSEFRVADDLLTASETGAVKIRETRFWIFGNDRRRENLRRTNRRKVKKRRVRRRVRRVVKKTPPPKWQIDGPQSGPVHIVVSLPEQKASVFRNGVHVVSAKVSTGKPGYSTPAGVFSILEKRRRHFSNLYDNAPMPYMQRLTWGGVALHEGKIPGYPASHGCIRLPKGFARELFSYTKRGAHVIVSNSETQPRPFSHPWLFQPITPASVEMKEKGVGSAERSAMVKAALHQAELERKAALPVSKRAFEEAPLRILITRRTKRQYRRDLQAMLNELGYDAGTPDGIFGRRTFKAVRKFQEDIGAKPTGVITEELIDKLYEIGGKERAASGHLFVRRKFRDLFDVPVVIRNPDKPLGNHFLTAMEIKNGDREAKWLAMTLRSRVQVSSTDTTAIPAISLDPHLSIKQTLDRIIIPPELRERLGKLLNSGASIAISDNGKGRMTGLGTDFIVLANKTYNPD